MEDQSADYLSRTDFNEVVSYNESVLVRFS